jgi:hypothetical protein
MSAQAVLEVTELLETILLNLPVKDLLFVQKTCKRFKEVVDSPSPLQKALFRRPGTVEHVRSDANIQYFDFLGQKFAVNPLLATYKPNYGQAYEISTNSYVTYVKNDAPVITLRPGTRRACIEYRKGAFGLSGGTYDSSSIPTMQPSCLRMHLTQPPLPAGIEVYYCVWAHFEGQRKSSV